MWHLSLVTQSDGNDNILLRMCLWSLLPVTLMLYLLCGFDSQIHAGKLGVLDWKGTLLFREDILRLLTCTAITFAKKQWSALMGTALMS